jgi:hypothetical protein
MHDGLKNELRFVRAPEAARLLGVSAHTLARKRWSGGGPPFRVLGEPGKRGAVVYEVNELLAWAIRHQQLTSTSDKGKLGDTR